jgi:hypothetical protein
MDASPIHFARVDFRNDGRFFGIKNEDRFSHVYVIGKTGTGKSTLIETMAPQDLELGNGFALIDPHGDLVARIAASIPPPHRERVVYLNVTDPTQPYGYNPLRHVREDRIALAASGMMDVFKKMWPDAWGVRMEHILRNVLQLTMMFSLSSAKSILLSKCLNRNGTLLRLNSATSRGSRIVGLISQVPYSRPVVFSFLNGSMPSLNGGITSGGVW